MFVTGRRTRILGAVTLALLGIGGIGIAAGNRATAADTPAVSHNIADYIAKKLDDVSTIMRVAQHDDNALAKISSDFGMIYKIRGDIQLRYKEENKLRVDGNLGASKATLINNGSIQKVRIPSLGLKKEDNLGKSPGKRKTLLDVGLISEGYLAYTQAEFRGERPVDGVMCAEFRISYRDKSLDTSHRMVWIDPKAKVIRKREEYSQEGKLNAIFYYKDPKEVAPGIWFPSRIEVTNAEGEKSGAMVYRDVKVNQGLKDDLF